MMGNAGAMAHSWNRGESVTEKVVHRELPRNRTFWPNPNSARDPHLSGFTRDRIEPEADALSVERLLS